MVFVKTDKLTVRTKVKQHDLQECIRLFMESDAECIKVRIKDGEYKNVRSCYTSLWKAVKVAKVRASVHLYDGHVYIIKD